MQHAEQIARMIEETGMGEMAAINRYLAERRIAADCRSGRGPIRASNWIK